MQKIPTNSSPTPRKTELPLDLSGPHVTPNASSQHRLYQALCHAIVGGIVKPGEPLPPSRTLAKQTGFRRNAVTSAYERLIADGFADATVGSGTFVAARIPARTSGARKTKIAIEAPQQGMFALGCTLIDDRAVQRFRSFAGWRPRAFGSEHLRYGDPRGSHGFGPRSPITCSRREGCAAIRSRSCWRREPSTPCGSCSAPFSRPVIRSGARIPAIRPRERRSSIAATVPCRCRSTSSACAWPQAAPSRLSARAAYVTPSHQFPLGVQMSMTRRLELLDWAKDGGAFVFEDDYDSEFRYDGAPLLSLAGIDHLQRVIYIGTFAKTLFPGLRLGYCALPERLIGPVTSARAVLDRYPGTLLEGAVADMLNSGAFAANLRKVRGLYREAATHSH